MVNTKVLMVLRTISHRDTVRSVTNDFVIILFNAKLPSEFKSPLAYPITLFISFSFFPIRATRPDGLTPSYSQLNP